MVDNFGKFKILQLKTFEKLIFSLMLTYDFTEKSRNFLEKLCIRWEIEWTFRMLNEARKNAFFFGWSQSIVGIPENISMKFQIKIRNTFSATAFGAPSIHEAGKRARDLRRRFSRNGIFRHCGHKKRNFYQRISTTQDFIPSLSVWILFELKNLHEK